MLDFRNKERRLAVPHRPLFLKCFWLWVLWFVVKGNGLGRKVWLLGFKISDLGLAFELGVQGSGFGFGLRVRVEGMGRVKV